MVSISLTLGKAPVNAANRKMLDLKVVKKDYHLDPKSEVLKLLQIHLMESALQFTSNIIGSMIPSKD